MTLSLLIPIHDKPLEVVDAVLKAAEGQKADEVIIVLDRARPELAERALAHPGAKLVTIDGPPGWRSPCTSFNRGLEAVTSDLVLLCHSDVIMTRGACEMAKSLQKAERAVYFGMVLESNPAMLGGHGHAGPVLMSAENSRAMLFFTCFPTEALRKAGGWDEAFEAGCCYEDDDLVARVWKTSGLPYIWDDRLAAVHQTHGRAYFMDEPIAINRGLYLKKHETTRFFWREEQLGRLKATRNGGVTRYDRT